jgi:class 3 adenylate cyclase
MGAAPDLQQTNDDLRRQLAERTAERDEALAREAAMAEVLGVINSSSGNLAPVFEMILTKATGLGEAIYGMLSTFDGERFHPVAIRSDPPFADWLRQRSPMLPRPGSPFEHIVQGERFVRIADTEKDSVYHASPGFRELAEIGGIRSHLVVALRKDDRLVGALVVFRREVEPFTDKQIALLENFAAQAVIAMENARLLTETREALEQQTATAEILRVIASSPANLQPTFDAIARAATTLCEAANGVVFRFDGSLIHLAAQYGVTAFQLSALRDTFPLPPGRGSITARAILTREVVHVPDLTADVEFAHPTLVEAGLLGGVSVPMLRDCEPTGAITVTRQETRPFADKQISLLQVFADQAVIAIENARLLGELKTSNEEIAALNRDLEARVVAQVDELGRVGRLKRFLAPQLAELIVSQGDERILESHRREIVVVFCDLRGYTAFTETAEPEEVLDFLREYHGALGPLVSQFEGTLDQFSGDGIMVFFNDPVPCPDPAERAVKMAMAMRAAASRLIAAWRRRHSCELGFGVGIAQGYATLGQIGFSERSGYTAIGTVCNLAARLCAEAKDGQILVSSRVAGAVEGIAKLDDLGDLEVKGLSRPVAAFNVMAPISDTPASA